MSDLLRKARMRRAAAINKRGVEAEQPKRPELVITRALRAVDNSKPFQLDADRRVMGGRLKTG